MIANSYVNGALFALEVDTPTSSAVSTTTLHLARTEAAWMHAKPCAVVLRSCSSIRRIVLETLRLTAHSIGGVRTVRKAGGFVIKAADGDRGFWVAPGETVALAHIPTHRQTSYWGPVSYAVIALAS